MSSSSSSTQNQTRTARMATRQHLSNQANQVGVCFVLNEYSDHPDTSAYMYGQNVPFTDGTNPTDTFDSDSFHCCRHQKHSYIQRSCHGRQRQTMGDRSRPQDRLEQIVQERNVSWHAVWFFCMIFGNCRQDTHSQDTSVQYSLITARTVHSMRLAQDQA